MTPTQITRAKRIISRLSRLGLQPIRIAKIYYPYRKWYLMRRVLINEKFTDEDLYAWETALINYKYKRVHETKSIRNRNSKEDTAGEPSVKKTRNEPNTRYD